MIPSDVSTHFVWSIISIFYRKRGPANKPESVQKAELKEEEAGRKLVTLLKQMDEIKKLIAHHNEKEIYYKSQKKSAELSLQEVRKKSKEIEDFLSEQKRTRVGKISWPWIWDRMK